MSQMDHVKLYLKNPSRVFYKFGGVGVFRWMSDEQYVRMLYKTLTGKKLNLENPTRYNEKIQWLKLYNHKPEYTSMVDKYEAKKYVASQIGDEYVIPSLGVWDRFEDIDFSDLPDQFVLKSTHDSGCTIICKDKSEFDAESAKRRLNKSLKRNYYWAGREWPYKNVKPRIIAEVYMEDTSTHELRDYKFFSFNGETKAMFIATDRQTPGEDVKFDFYDMDFNHLPIKHGHENSKQKIEKPNQFDLMHELADKLSVDIPAVRVDFYEVNGRVYFGELTFSHHGGVVPFVPDEWDYKFGEWIELPKEKII